ncbi:MAG: hypothetical protein AAF092_05040 [Pseudomonadota bacterium]
MSYILCMGDEARHERINDMTQAEQQLADDKVRAEIANLVAQTAKLNAETAKIARERFMIPVTIFTGLVVAAATLLARVL